jgi:hypothetical protein
VIAEAKPRDDFVEDEHGAVRLGQLAQLPQILRRLQQQTIVGGHRLDDGRRQVLAMLAERLFEHGDVTERNHERIGGHLRGYAGAVSQALRDHAAARLHHE